MYPKPHSMYLRGTIFANISSDERWSNFEVLRTQFTGLTVEHILHQLMTCLLPLDLHYFGGPQWI